nr:Uncharacterised protein [Klebsiella pneumoniae]
MYFMSAMQHFFTILIRHRALRRGMMAFASEVAHLTSRRTFHNVQNTFRMPMMPKFRVSLLSLTLLLAVPLRPRR